MPKVRKIGVLSGGGDSPGINAALRAIVRRASRAGIEVIGFHDGWRGPIEDDWKPIGLGDISGILHVGGTILGTSRTNPFRKVKKDDETVWEPTEQVEKIVENSRRHGVDVLIPIGGDDTLGVAHNLSRYGQNVVGIPQTIDNDLFGTDYAIGFHSALAVVTDALDRLHTTAHSHHRTFIVEVMGRDSGWIALLGGLAGGADVILVPEEPFSVDQVIAQIQDRLDRGKRFSIVTVAEGARPQELGGKPVAQEARVDAFGHPQLGGIGYWLAGELFSRKDWECRVTVLGHLQRGGNPTPFDRLLATELGARAVEFALEGKFDVMAGLNGTQVLAQPIAQVLAGSPKCVDPELLSLVHDLGLG